jgi:6-phosphogluconolactonase
MPDIIKFESRDAASTGAAARIAGLVDAKLQRNSAASVVVGGGTSPAKCFSVLSAYDLAWEKVQVVLSDERWVPNDHAESNEKLIRETLLVDNAASASVLPIYQSGLSVDERCDSLQSHLPQRGFACSMAGMGADGHFASLFPDADNLEAGLSLDNHRFYMPIRTDASPHPRISMTLHALLQGKEILLLFFGEEKMSIFEKALAGDQSYPVAALLKQQETSVTLYWAP